MRVLPRRSARALLLCASAALGIAPALRAQAAGPDNVAGSRHNMSSRSGLTNYNEVCVYCHTPHGGQTQNAPLWNRNFGIGPYQMYNSSYSSTIDMQVAASPQGVSLACLSCHDGTIGLDVIVNRPNADTARAGSGNTMPANSGQLFANLGTDMRNDHPVSITYDNVADPAFNPPSGGRVGGVLPLYLGRVECGSCHNPHNTSFSPFLRVSNSASSLCRTCHIK
jgi:predicted CXXCH cytochrome family protein